MFVWKPDRLIPETLAPTVSLGLILFAFHWLYTLLSGISSSALRYSTLWVFKWESPKVEGGQGTSTVCQCQRSYHLPDWGSYLENRSEKDQTPARARVTRCCCRLSGQSWSASVSLVWQFFWASSWLALLHTSRGGLGSAGTHGWVVTSGGITNLPQQVVLLTVYTRWFPLPFSWFFMWCWN